MGITENAAYLKGLAEGLKLDESTNEGKLIVKMLELIGEMADRIDTLEKQSDELYTYIVTLITATRRHPALALGASPRASVAMVHLSQAYAFLRGRDYVLPDDIAALFRAAIAHRLMLRQEAKLAHQTTVDVLTEILRTTDVPYKGKRGAKADAKN